MKKLFLTSISALLLATGAAHAEWIASMRTCSVYRDVDPPRAPDDKSPITGSGPVPPVRLIGLRYQNCCAPSKN
jgi:hypothetical protein